MAERGIHNATNAKRRGEGLPARLRIVARRGTTLVELLIAMLILTIVCVSWIKIICIQSARKEARRREAVEHLVGMMDLFMYDKRNESPKEGNYYITLNTNNLDLVKYTITKITDTNQVHLVFDEADSPIGYQLLVVKSSNFRVGDMSAAWGNNMWLVGSLYERSGTVAEAGRRFCTLPVCLWK